MFKLLTALLVASTAFLFSSAHPTAHPKLQARQSATVYTQCSVANKVALTFDDGPYYNLQNIVNKLDQYGAKGTFFFSGSNWACIYDTTLRGYVKYAYDHGHQVASHTWSHKNLATLTWDQIHDEMWKVELALLRITGAYVGMMRPPYGSYNGLVQAASGVRGQAIINWDLDSGDSAGYTLAQQKAVYDARIATTPKPSSILALNHETYSTTVDLLEYIIPRLQAQGYQLVTVAECLGLPAYQWVGSPESPTSEWHC